MKKVLLGMLLFFSALGIQAQETVTPHRSVFLELGGAGMAYSFNYDFRFDQSRMDSWGMRVGAGGYGLDGDSFFSLPVMVNRLYGKGPHYFELGAGLTFFAYNYQRYSYCTSGYVDANGMYICTNTFTAEYPYEFILPVDGSPSVMGTMNFGYRKIPVNGGFTWRVSLTPIFNNNGFWPLFAGFGFGYAF
ncbi:MAG: hypothetical protein MUE75_00220 [Algoriphagus sp.]|jgi:hypothetical protein|nr:hypothetical protein [Algoriphagus sp.]